jgi:hypothetical protein
VVADAVLGAEPVVAGVEAVGTSGVADLVAAGAFGLVDRSKWGATRFFDELLEGGSTLGPVVPPLVGVVPVGVVGVVPVGVEPLGLVGVVGGVVGGFCVSAGYDAATTRKRSCAVSPIVCARLESTLPGISTMTMSLPWVVTSASETPEPLTRELMMSLAWLSLSLVTVPPMACACRVMRVPPWRSSPSLGFQFPSDATVRYMMPRTIPKISRVRVGLDDLLATSVHSCVIVAGLPAGRAGYLVRAVRGRLVLDDLGDGTPVDPDDSAGRELDVHYLALDVDHGAEEPAREHDLVAGGQGGLQRRGRLGALARGPDQEEITHTDQQYQWQVRL